MNEQEKFLSRWSRRKREASDETAPPEALPEMPAAPDQQAALPPAADTPPEFDLSKLPSLDSIGAASDLKPFLQAGVPSALKHAALRRAWAADPAIRDFKGLAENDWDFTSAGGAPGFGEIDPQLDVKKLLAEIFGDAKPAEETPPRVQPTPPAAEPVKVADITEPEEAASAGPQQTAPLAGNRLVQRDENIATQQDDTKVASTDSKIRRHGGAMPE
jgi:hypothetical protein